MDVSYPCPRSAPMVVAAAASLQYIRPLISYEVARHVTFHSQSICALLSISCMCDGRSSFILVKTAQASIFPMCVLDGALQISLSQTSKACYWIVCPQQQSRNQYRTYRSRPYRRQLGQFVEQLVAETGPPDHSTCWLAALLAGTPTA